MHHATQRSFAPVLTVAACLLVAAGCARGLDAEDYVAFGDELSMAEKFPSMPDLPVAMTRFESELGRLPVAWENRSFNAVGKGKPTCPYPESLDRDTRTRLSQCLVIREKADGRPGQRYVAFIDVESRVVLVENIIETSRGIREADAREG